VTNQITIETYTFEPIEKLITLEYDERDGSHYWQSNFVALPCEEPVNSRRSVKKIEIIIREIE
jgi:hypothetical protein